MARATLPTLVFLLACGNGKLAGEDEGGGDGGPALDDTGGDEEVDRWAAAGSGVAYLLDGSTDNSLFHLEISATIPPREGEVYVGWLSGGADGPVELGEITVTSGSVLFEAEIGFNGLLAGYDTLDVYAGPPGVTAATGEHLWTGQIDPALKGAYERLLISNSSTPGSEGSGRAIESTIEAIQAFTQADMDASTPVETLNEHAALIRDTIRGEGSASIDGTMAILGDEGLVELILADLDVASAAVEPGNPVKDLANFAYDCVQRIETHASEAARKADVATVCAGEDYCDSVLATVVENLQYALDGYDLNEDGTVDPTTEGTVECAVYNISQMAYMEVAVP